MKKKLKKIFLFGFLIFLLIQFYQPTRNVDNRKISSIHFNTIYNVPNNVQSILTTACFDCHSNNTQYPWYSYIQPTRFLMENHIKVGKKNLNFSEWGNYSSRKQNNKLERITKQIKANEMPLSSYTFIHRNAKLSFNQKQEIINWINQIIENNE